MMFWTTGYITIQRWSIHCITILFKHCRIQTLQTRTVSRRQNTFIPVMLGTMQPGYLQVLLLSLQCSRVRQVNTNSLQLQQQFDKQLFCSDVDGYCYLIAFLLLWNILIVVFLLFIIIFVIVNFSNINNIF